MTILKDEIAYFNTMLPEWMKCYEGKFALIHNQQLVDTFTTDAEAYKEGVNRFGNQVFLIKRITLEKPIAQLPALSLGLIRAYT